MRVDRKLNLVVPVERDDGPTVYVHSTPISEEVFDAYYLVLSKTFTQIYTQGLNAVGGPRIAAKLMRDVAKSIPRADPGGKPISWWEGSDGVERGLWAEIRRLTNVMAPADAGWQQMPYEDAIKRGVLSADEIAEVEGAIVFFISNWCMHRKSQALEILEAAAGLWGWETTFSPFTAWRSSLPTLTPTEPTGAKPEPSSIPS